MAATKVTIPITADKIAASIESYTIQDSNMVDTVTGGKFKDGVFTPTTEKRPDRTSEALNKIIANVMYDTLKAILTSTSIKVDGVI